MDILPRFIKNWTNFSDSLYNELLERLPQRRNNLSRPEYHTQGLATALPGIAWPGYELVIVPGVAVKLYRNEGPRDTYRTTTLEYPYDTTAAEVATDLVERGIVR